MKNLRMKYTAVVAVCLLLLVLLPASCIKDDYAAKEKATVQVTFTAKAETNTTVAGSKLEPNERMQTLRVIVAKGNDILYNVYYADNAFDTDPETGVRSKTITFSELTVSTEGEDFDFYAIANEAGTGYSDWSSVTIDDLKSRTLTNIANLNTNRTTVVPQTAKTTIRVTPQSDGNVQKVTIPLQFVVAKVRLTINNKSSVEQSQSVTDIQLSGVNTTSTSLFPTSLSSVGGAIKLSDVVTIPAGEAETVDAYFYENALDNSGAYILSADWKGSQTLNITDKASIREIRRGTMLDINVTLNADINSSIVVEVVPWTNKEMGVTFD